MNLPLKEKKKSNKKIERFLNFIALLELAAIVRRTQVRFDFSVSKLLSLKNGPQITVDSVRLDSALIDRRISTTLVRLGT